METLSFAVKNSHTIDNINMLNFNNKFGSVKSKSNKINLILNLTMKLIGVNTSELLSYYIHNYLVENLLFLIDNWISGITICMDCGESLPIDYLNNCPACQGKIRNKIKVEQIIEEYHLINTLIPYFNNDKVSPVINELLIYAGLQMSLIIDINDLSRPNIETLL